MHGPQHGDDDRGTHLDGIEGDHLASAPTERTTRATGMAAAESAVQKNPVQHRIGEYRDEQRADTPGGAHEGVDSVFSLRRSKRKVNG